ncbi:MAG: hypothetical protein P8P74_07475 [Crocinitomicaceae bacterium]|nr:hypothetical protein [Crocinitomicaceae bacterium]
MIVFFKRHWISLSLLIVASIVGLVQYDREDPINISLIEYEFKSSDQDQLPDFTQADTVFKFEDVFCRNYIGSVGDTLKDEGIRRFELKLYMPRMSKIALIDMSRIIFDSSKIRVIKDQFIETQKNRQKLLYWILFGLFLGMLAEFLISLKRKPSTN